MTIHRNIILIILLFVTLIATVLYYMYCKGGASGKKNRDAASENLKENNYTPHGNGNGNGNGNGTATTPKYDKKIEDNIEYEISMLPNLPADEINLEILKIITKIDLHKGKQLTVSKCDKLIKKAKAQNSQKPTTLAPTRNINNILDNESTEQTKPTSRGSKPR